MRNEEQRLEALRRANAVRVVRAAVKRDVRAGEIEAWPLIADPGPELVNMHVRDLLLAVPKLGTVKVGALMRRLAIVQGKTLGGLSTRQREALVVALRGQR